MFYRKEMFNNNSPVKIVLSGVETINKGAELMLYAILQEIEKQYPNAEVYIPTFALKNGLESIKTSLRLKYKPCAPFLRLARKFKIVGLAKKIHFPTKFFNDMYALKNADYFFDASGFRYSDQWERMLNNIYPLWKKQFSVYKQQGTKIIFLPQAFGPLQKPLTQKFLHLVSDTATLVMAREKISYSYLKDMDFDMSKVSIFPDFTAVVKGEFPHKYGKFRNGVCIIPNARMVDKGVISIDDYILLINSIVDEASASGHPVFFLNHEGKEDEELALLASSRLNKKIEVISDLDALEVKGLISSSYLCISSRFHGVASALNSGVPCLATSWSHKYQELFKDFGMKDCILPLDDISGALAKVRSLLKDDNNNLYRESLTPGRLKMYDECSRMWSKIWNS